MKKNLTILILIFSSLWMFGQTEKISVELKWSIENDLIADSIIKLISFKGAARTPENLLPYYFHEKALINNDNNYTVEIENAEYTAASPEEIEILKHFSFPEKAEAKTKVARTNNQFSLEIEIFPFVKKGEIYQKLKRFKISITEEKNSGIKRNLKAANRHSYTKSSILSQGRFIKLRVTESGVYKLTYADLKRKGLKPQDVRLFGYGGAVLEEDFSKPITDDLPEVAVHDTGDALLFYAQGVTKWTYNSALRMFTHKNNSYSKYGYYFVTDNNNIVGEKKRIPQKEIISAENPKEIDEFTDYVVHERELINLANSGREFFGEKFQINDNNKSFGFQIPNITKPLLLNIELAATAPSDFTLSLNNQEQVVKISGFENSYQERARTNKETKLSFETNSDKPVFNLRFNANGSNTVAGYLNYIEINAKRKLIMHGFAMPFHNLQINDFNRYRLKTNDNNIQIWEITDPTKVEKIKTEKKEGEISFIDSADETKSYIAINLDKVNSLPSAELLNDVANQNIHGMPAADMLIITHPRFLAHAEKLAAAHKTLNNLKVGIVTTEQVYNEFSSGTPDATAYRRAAKFFYEKENKNNRLKYLLLFGRGTFDNRQLQQGSQEALILTYQSENSVHRIWSYVTDDYFGMLEDERGKNISSDKMDVAVGRFPVSSDEEARVVVEKSIDYMSKGKGGSWNNKICFMGDDGDEAMHMEQANSLADNLRKNYPQFQVKKILLDSYQKEKTATGTSYPSAKNYFKRLWDSGLLIYAYMGHAYGTGLAEENILTIKDIKTMSNKPLPLFIAGACDVSSFDNKSKSIGEELLLTKRGGAIASFSSARTVYANPNFYLIKNFFENLFKEKNDQKLSIADIIRIAKNNQGKEINKLSFMYFGDPALKLNSPTRYEVKTTKINNRLITEETKDTLKALSTVTIEGEILNEKGELAHNFNGYLHADVFDKKETITSLKNPAKESKAITFVDYPNIIFSGRAEVKEGRFKYTFLVPKNIRYNYGEGRIIHVAWDKQNNSGHGSYSNFIVGGSNKKFVEENEGPKVKAYLNHPSFVNGGTVNESPLFVAKIFDESGINISGTGIGQDATLTITSKNNEQYILNDSFLGDLNTYKSGTISFKIPPLPAGEHSLSFKVWDLSNNSTTVKIDFYVSEVSVPEFLSVKAYPNPANEHCYIELDYKSEDIIYEELHLDVFDVSGRLISSTQDILIDKRIRWDLNVNGQKVPPGVYIYRVYLKGGKKILSSKANKLIVKY